MKSRPGREGVPLGGSPASSAPGPPTGPCQQRETQVRVGKTPPRGPPGESEGLRPWKTWRDAALPCLCSVPSPRPSCSPAAASGGSLPAAPGALSRGGAGPCECPQELSPLRISARPGRAQGRGWRAVSCVFIRKSYPSCGAFETFEVGGSAAEEGAPGWGSDGNAEGTHRPLVTRS